MYYICLHAQSHLTLCNPRDCSLPGLSVHGIFQARILEWVAISYSRGCFQPRDQTQVSCVSCIGRQIIYLCHLGSPTNMHAHFQKEKCACFSKGSKQHELELTMLRVPVKLSYSTSVFNNHSDPRPSMGKVPPGSWGHCSIFDKHSCLFQMWSALSFFFFLT